MKITCFIKPIVFAFIVLMAVMSGNYGQYLLAQHTANSANSSNISNSSNIANTSDAADNLAQKTSKRILDYFKDENNIQFAIIKYENHSHLSDLGAHKFYQQLASAFESGDQTNIAFSDLMINFHQSTGEFNLNRIDRLNYVLYIKLITNKTKLGAGFAVFSRNLDKITHIGYVEVPFPPGETTVYETSEYGFKSIGFSMQLEMEAQKDLLDFKNIDLPEEGTRYFFYYPDAVEVFKFQVNQLRKEVSIPLKWGRPYYPVMDPEGRLTLFRLSGGQVMMTAGGNFAPYGKVFAYENAQWRETSTLNFMPMKLIKFNATDYLAGARYEEGKNFFKDKLCLVPIDGTHIQTDMVMEKQIPFFYGMDFSTFDGTALESIHLVDIDYKHRFFAGDFEERTVEPQRRGGAVAALGGSWLAVSAYSQNNDTLFFYKTEEGGKRLIYENNVEGQIIFISPGTWKSNDGFWVYLARQRDNGTDKKLYRLQFWSKKNE